jgi:hypothetical protein
VSQIGRYTSWATTALGGLASAAAAFRDQTTARLLAAYLLDSPSDDNGVFLSSTRRRYLTFDQARNVTGSSAGELRTTLDDLLEKSLLRRGVVLKCNTCNEANWYGTASMGEGARLDCRRCESAIKVTPEAWLQPLEEPHWFYELNELLYRAVKNNCQVPILALEYLSRRARTFQYSPELDLAKAGTPHAEIDLLCFRDGKIILGEAKSTERISSTTREARKSLERLRAAAVRLGAHEVVLATSKPAWHASATSLAREMLSKGSFAVRLLQGLAQSGESTALDGD